MAVRDFQRVAVGGTSPVAHAATGGGDKINVPAAEDDVILRVTNGGVGSITLTVVTPGTVGGFAVADDPVTIGAGATKYVRIVRDLFKNAEGQVDLTWSGVTSVTFEVVS